MSADGRRREGLTYASAGVDIDAADDSKHRIKRLVESTFTAGARGAFGGFGGMFRVPEGMRKPLLVSSADGVGTKIKVAIEADRHDTIGHCLVNHCVNDILVQGARPLFFLDYVAFGKLLPAHSESLKQPALSELDHNLMVKQLDAIFLAPMPGQDSGPRHEAVTALPEGEIEKRFTPEEAQRVGLVEESSVDWAGEVVDIDLSEGAAAQMPANASAPPDGEVPVLDIDLDLGMGVDINLDLSTPDPGEPTQGAQLIDHIKVGFAYQMHLKDEWQKVRLSFVSPGRSFFVFTHGRKHEQTVSLTARMLSRMCESGRMRAVESTYLMERATARARAQLAALKSTPRTTPLSSSMSKH